MASFANALKPEDTVALRAYLTERANELKNAPPPGGLPAAPHGQSARTVSEAKKALNRRAAVESAQPRGRGSRGSLRRAAAERSLLRS